MSIRSIYASIGVEVFYSSGMAYENQHARQVEDLIRRNHLALQLESVLDLACGNGLVTSSLQSLGYSNIIGIDPFLNTEYTKRTGCICHKLSFKDIITKGFDYNFSCIICSFALHLCDKSMLPNLLWRLSDISNKLVIISPSKFPIIGKPHVEDFCLTSNNKRVQFREYNLPIL
jgi:hypothetical protein